MVRSDRALVLNPFHGAGPKAASVTERWGELPLCTTRTKPQPYPLRVVIWNFPNFTSIPPADFGSRSWRCRLLLSLQVFNVGFWVLRAVLE